MECERLTKLIKSWYIQVKDEALAPARMVDFMKTHLAGCPVCMGDLVVESEVKRIIELILPATKIPKIASRENEAGYDNEGESSELSGDAHEEIEEQVDEELADEEEDIDELEDEDDDI
jgi:hypothetical protein